MNHPLTSDPSLLLEEEVYLLADLFHLFADPTRLKILFSLLPKERSVGELATLLQMTPSAVSHQLKLLKGEKLVRYRRSGKSLIYGLADEHVRLITNVGLEHIRE